MTSHDHHMTITWHHMTSHELTWHHMTSHDHHMTSHDYHMTSHDTTHVGAQTYSPSKCMPGGPCCTRRSSHSEHSCLSVPDGWGLCDLSVELCMCVIVWVWGGRVGWQIVYNIWNSKIRQKSSNICRAWSLSNRWLHQGGSLCCCVCLARTAVQLLIYVLMMADLDMTVKNGIIVQ